MNDDLISRQAAIDALAKNMPSWTTPDGSGQFDHDIQVTDEAYVDCMQIIHDMPSTTKKCYNVNPDYAECDQFVCSNCGIELQDWRRVERDEDGEITYHEYEFRFCPNCGAKL